MYCKIGCRWLLNIGAHGLGVWIGRHLARGGMMTTASHQYSPFFARLYHLLTILLHVLGHDHFQCDPADFQLPVSASLCPRVLSKTPCGKARSARELMFPGAALNSWFSGAGHFILTLGQNIIEAYACILSQNVCLVFPVSLLLHPYCLPSPPHLISPWSVFPLTPQ